MAPRTSFVFSYSCQYSTSFDSAKAPSSKWLRFSFTEARFEKNISEWRNLSCGRLDLDGPSECQWEDGEAACSEVEWDGAGGISCRCNRSGSYALIWSREIERVSGLQEVHRCAVCAMARISGEEEGKKTNAAEHKAASLQGWVLCCFHCSGHRELPWGSADLFFGNSEQRIDFVLNRVWNFPIYAH